MTEPHRIYDVAIAASIAALFLEAPPVLYAILTYKQFEFFSLSGYIPHEELSIALRSGKFTEILAAPLLSLNMTSGHLFSNVYVFTLGAVMSSAALGSLTGWAMAMQVRSNLRGSHLSLSKSLVFIALGLTATFAVSSAGLLGCHGRTELSGEILTQIGFGPVAAAELARISPYLQLGLLGMLSMYCATLWRRCKLNRLLESR